MKVLAFLVMAVEMLKDAAGNMFAGNMFRHGSRGEEGGKVLAKGQFGRTADLGQMVYQWDGLEMAVELHCSNCHHSSSLGVELQYQVD